MTDARSLMQPLFELTRTVDCISVARDNSVLFRVYPRSLKFNVDLISNPHVAQEYTELQKKAAFNKKVYGVFGFVKFPIFSYLILIEEASLVG